MKKIIFLAFLIGVNNFLFGQTEVESLIPNAMPFGAYVNYMSLKVCKSKENLPINDTIYKLKFIPAKFDTIAWDSVLILNNAVCFHLKNKIIGDTNHLIFSENNKIYDISPPVFRKNTLHSHHYKHYTSWETTKKYSDCIAVEAKYCEVMVLVEHSIKIKSKEIKLAKPAMMHLKEGEKDTIYELFPPSPYLEMDTIKEKYQYIPILGRKTFARIDTIREIGNYAQKEEIQKNKKYFIGEKKVNNWQSINCSVCYSRANMIEQIQLALQKRNYYKGEINNQITPETRMALVKFQQDHYLEQGKISMETLEELEIEKE